MFNNLLRSLKAVLYKTPSTRTAGVPQTFDLTDEEIIEVEREFGLFKDYAVHPDIAVRLKAGLTARGLASYAGTRLMFAGFDSQRTERPENLKKATVALAKAYSFYQLPIYLYDSACCLEMSEMLNEAEGLFETFLKRMRGYKPDQLDTVILGDRDLGAAVADAKAKLRHSRV